LRKKGPAFRMLRGWAIVELIEDDSVHEWQGARLEAGPGRSAARVGHWSLRVWNRRSEYRHIAPTAEVHEAFERSGMFARSANTRTIRLPVVASAHRANAGLWATGRTSKYRRSKRHRLRLRPMSRAVKNSKRWMNRTPKTVWKPTTAYRQHPTQKHGNCLHEQNCHAGQGRATDRKVSHASRARGGGLGDVTSRHGDLASRKDARRIT
jgi:hypothetical protein